MKTFRNILLISAVSFVSASIASAQIAQWTFESSFASIAGTSTTLGGLAPEIGTGVASGTHASASAWSSPSGNGSAHSFSVNTWAVGDYFQFSLSTVGSSGIGVSFDQTGSNTGPKAFDLAYSTDGSTFTTFGSYSLVNGSWSAGSPTLLPTSFSFDLSAITALNNAPSVYFRLIDTSTTSINGSTVAAGGTSRVDNFTVSVVPEPSSVLLGLLGAAGLVITRRRKA